MILFVESPRSKRRRKALLLGILVLAVSVWFAANDYRHSVTPGSDMPRETSWARSTVMPDIMVSAIELLPLIPVAGETFSLNVFCQNIGIVTTGEYRLEVSLFDGNGDRVYTGRSAGNGALDPGQTGAAFSSKAMRLDRPGRYEIRVLVSPEGFEDSNLANNRASRRFDVQ